MANTKVEQDKVQQLILAEKLMRSETNVVNMSQYHQHLIKWSRNIDKRYAWVALSALCMIMATCLGTYRMYGLIYAKVTAIGAYNREQASWPASTISAVENIVGPLVSIFVYKTSFKASILMGGILLATGNIIAYWSTSLILDIILIGGVQGIGFAFILVPHMELINNYFVRYRNLALGCALNGGTLAVFGLLPIYHWILETYHWRTAYLITGLICSLIVLFVPFLKPNPQIIPPNINQNMGKLDTNSQMILITEANTIGSPNSFVAMKNEPEFMMTIIWSIIKTPRFHLIWYLEMVYFWVYNLYCMFLVDYGVDRGLTKAEAENLLQFRSIGEILGRLVLAIIVDLQFLSNSNTIILVLSILAGLLVANTLVTSLFWFSIITSGIAALESLLYILLNCLLVDFLGERQVTIGYGMASSIVGLLIIFRPQVIGYFRDTIGSYDQLMICFGLGCALGAIFFIIEQFFSRTYRKKQITDDT